MSVTKMLRIHSKKKKVLYTWQQLAALIYRLLCWSLSPPTRRKPTEMLTNQQQAAAKTETTLPENLVTYTVFANRRSRRAQIICHIHTLRSIKAVEKESMQQWQQL